MNVDSDDDTYGPSYRGVNSDSDQSDVYGPGSMKNSRLRAKARKSPGDTDGTYAPTIDSAYSPQVYGNVYGRTDANHYGVPESLVIPKTYIYEEDQLELQRVNEGNFRHIHSTKAATSNRGGTILDTGDFSQQNQKSRERPQVAPKPKLKLTKQMSDSMSDALPRQTQREPVRRQMSEHTAHSSSPIQSGIDRKTSLQPHASHNSHPSHPAHAQQVSRSRSTGVNPLLDLANQKYFDCNISRDVASEKLLKKNKDGCYVLRNSSEMDGYKFALTIFCSKVKNKIRHVHITCDRATGECWAGDINKSEATKVFSGIRQLMQNWIENGVHIEDTHVKLSKPLD